jgi:hypothetical protein
MTYAAPTIAIKQREATHVGSRYEGEVSVKTKRREGEGTYMYPNSFFTYQGQWLDGKKHGRGRLSFSDGGYYEGDFEQGEINGQGSQRWPDGAVYTGQFINGERHGEGRIDRSDGSTYSGTWQRNKYSGKGELTLPNGDCYIGELSNHKFHGKGVLTQPKADRRYEGLFQTGLFEGEGELRENGGKFVYVGQFKSGCMCGEGRGSDVPSGIVYAGAWEANQPTRRSVSWDLRAPATAEDRAGESFVPASQALREEAANQLNPVDVDPKAKGKAKAKAKGKDVAPSPEPEDTNIGPSLELTAGETLPEIVLRIVDNEQQVLCESGRRFRISMFKERREPKKEDPSTFNVLRREVRFGDMRQTYVDPLDEPPSEAPPQKPPPSPSPNGEDAVAGDEEKEEGPSIGEACIEDVVGEQGAITIGNSDAWLLPVHLSRLIYWLRVEDVTQIGSQSFFEALPPLEIPVRVKSAASAST